MLANIEQISNPLEQTQQMSGLFVSNEIIIWIPSLFYGKKVLKGNVVVNNVAINNVNI